MRGLISDPQGKIIDLHVQRHLHKRFPLTEYHLLRVVDNAVWTVSNAEYRMCKIVEAVQHIVVTEQTVAPK